MGGYVAPGRAITAGYPVSSVSLLAIRPVCPTVTTVDAPSVGHIRPATRADLMAVVHIERRVFSEPWRLSAFEQFLDAPGFLVMEDPAGGGLGEDLAGYIVADTIQVRGRPIGHVKDLAVKPERQQEGRGSELLERGLRVLSSHGARMARLEVRPSNAQALGLYRKVGFRLQRRHENYYPDGEDALILVAPIEP